MKANSKATTTRARTRTPRNEASERWASQIIEKSDQARERVVSFMHQADDFGGPLSDARGLALAMASLIDDLAPHDSGAMITVARCLLGKIDRHISDLERAREDARACGLIQPTDAELRAAA
jgi:hypothetical protein